VKKMENCDREKIRAKKGENNGHEGRLVYRLRRKERREEKGRYSVGLQAEKR